MLFMKNNFQDTKLVKYYNDYSIDLLKRLKIIHEEKPNC